MIETKKTYSPSASFFEQIPHDASAPVFGEAYEVLETMDTLQRLSEFDVIINNLNRKSLLEKLGNIWIGGENSLVSLEEKKAALCETLTRSFRLAPGLAKYYGPLINAIETEEDFKRCLHNFRLDAKSILSKSPLVKSCRGQNGPTFLVGYTRLDSNFEHPSLQKFVLKWTHWNEACSTRIYDAFSRQCACLYSERLDFIVPKASVFDLNSCMYEMIDCSKKQLNNEMAQKFRDKFDGIRLAVCPGMQPKDDQIMLIERVAASNLYDFADKKFKELSFEQKQELYVGLGRLAMLDVFMGNTDRLVQFGDYNPSKGFELVPWESNLGNVMIGLTSGERAGLFLYAIDNGIDQRLITDSKCNAAYNLFLEQLLGDQNMLERLAGVMIPSIAKDIRDHLAQSDIKDPNQFNQLKLDLEFFILDLNSEEAKSEILHGLADMCKKLNEVLLPFWESKQSDFLKQHLSETHPILLEVISGRFEILKPFTRSYHDNQSECINS